MILLKFVWPQKYLTPIFFSFHTICVCRIWIGIRFFLSIKKKVLRFVATWQVGTEEASLFSRTIKKRCSRNLTNTDNSVNYVLRNFCLAHAHSECVKVDEASYLYFLLYSPYFQKIIETTKIKSMNCCFKSIFLSIKVIIGEILKILKSGSPRSVKHCTFVTLKKKCFYY